MGIVGDIATIPDWLLHEYKQPVLFGILTFAFAIIATLHVAFQLWLRYKERKEALHGRVFVEAGEFLAFDANTGEEEDPIIYFHIVNDGLKPVFIEKVVLRIRGQRESFCPKNAEQIKVLLAQGQQVERTWDKARFVSDLKKRGFSFPIKCRGVFLTNTKRKHLTNWFKVHEGGDRKRGHEQFPEREQSVHAVGTRWV